MRVLALVEGAEHVCCRYRVRAFAQALAASGATLTVEPLAAGPSARWRQLGRAARFDVTILQRKLLPSWQWRRLRAGARRLVFDFDDAVFLRDSYHPRGSRSPGRARRFARTVREADAVLAGNRFLARRAVEAGAVEGNVHVLPTCIEPDRYPPKRAGFRGGPTLTAVWIGSSSTLQGLERRGPLWEELAKGVPGLRLRLIADRAARFGPLPVEFVPWSEATEAAALAGGDVGISLVPDDDWSRGKCGLKVLQYQGVGLPVVADPIGVHPEMVEAGVSGFLPESPGGFVDAFRALAADPASLAEMGAAGRASVVARYSVAAWSGRFVAALAGAEVHALSDIA
ncbi:MAG TPA: glycosyltransferase family 4 protein [Isosphaeraceae bacterium]|jgi:glycosyltransferase involved in cell wall biosynthesis|nr:glycosyltransferase family 4 protein [Isosphaeraceae bacterium]